MLKKLPANIFIFGISNILKSLVPLLMLPILTAYLSLDDFGILSIVETTIIFLSPFIILNINTGINREYFDLERENLKLYITNALLLTLFASLLMLLLVFLLQKDIASLLHISQSLVLFLIIFAFLRVLGTVVIGLLQVSHQAIKFASFSLVQTIGELSLSYLFVVVYESGYVGRLEGTYIMFFIMSLFSLYYLYMHDYLGKINFVYTKKILFFTLPLIPHAIGGTVIAMSDRYFISYFEGNAQVGLYTIAYQMSAILLLVSMSVNQAWTPYLFKLLKIQELKKIYTVSFLLFLLFLFAFLVIYFLQGFLFFLFVDEKFYEAKEFFFYLLLGFLFQSFYFLVTNFLFYQKRTFFLASLTMSGALLNIGLNYYFIQIFGTIGVAYATAITWGIFSMIVALSSMKYLQGLRESLCK